MSDLWKISKRKICCLVQWGVAFLISILLVNFVIFPFYHFSAWIDIPANATTAIFNPGSIIINGEEGYGIRRVDCNGYANPERRTEYDSYVLIMGASHSVGKEIPCGFSFADLLENKYGFQVYNAAMDGHYYPQIVNGFEAAMREFPGADAVVIEISSTDFDLTELREALKQRKFDEKYLGKNIRKNLSIKQKGKIIYQEALPLLRIINKNLKTAQLDIGQIYDEKTQEDISRETMSYMETVAASMQQIRDCYSGQVVIVYHPKVELQKDGTMKPVEEKTCDMFEQLCEKYGIQYIDMGKAFADTYALSYEVPYGFMNTALGSGHLNKTGHGLIAEELAELLGAEK